MKISEKLREYEQQILKSFQSYSIIPNTCKLVKVPQDYEFGTFNMVAHRIKIKKEILFEENSTFVVDNLGTDMAHAEIKYLLNEITKKSKPQTINSIATRDKLIEFIGKQIENGFNPDFIFVPIDYYMDVWKWTSEGIPSHVRVKHGYEWYIDNDIRLKIKYSNKRTPFDYFIITDSKYNKWFYKSDPNTSERLTASFDTNTDDINAYLNLKTVFKLSIEDPKTNLILKFKPKKKVS